MNTPIKESTPKTPQQRPAGALQGAKKIFTSRETSMFVILVIFCVAVQLRSPTFLTFGSITSMLQNYTTTILMSLGMMCVLLIGGIDISIGSTLAFSGMCGAILVRDNPQLPIIVPILVCTLIGTLVGLLQGVIISKGHVPPIICTMGFMSIMRGMTYIVSDNSWVSSYQLPDSFRNFARGTFLGLNNMIWFLIVAYIIFFFVMKWTRFGRQIYAIGCNEEGARISGIKVDFIKTACYTILGALTGLSSFLFVSFYSSAQNDSGTGFEMNVIAACVLGGVSLTGGRGSVVGVLIGALTITVLGQGLPLLGLDALWQDAIKGIIILVAVIVNVILARRLRDARKNGKEG